MVAMIEYLDALERDTCLRVNRLGRRSAMRRFFTVVSQLGDGGFWLAAGAAIVVLRGPAALPLVLHIALTGLIGVVIYKFLKQFLVRERPYITCHAIECGAAPLDRYSFPSGHTLHAVSFAILTSYVEPILLVVTLPFAMLVAASRVVLGLHYPSDVLAGATIGATLACLSLYLIG